MMLAVDDVDGLVSGAVHTHCQHGAPGLAADQTARDSSIVSSAHAHARSSAGLR